MQMVGVRNMFCLDENKMYSAKRPRNNTEENEEEEEKATMEVWKEGAGCVTHVASKTEGRTSVTD